MSGQDILSRIEGEEVPGIPSFLYDTSLGTYFADIDVRDIYRNGFDAELSARSISASRKALGHDGVIGSLLCTDCRAFGAEYTYFMDRQPMMVKPAFSDPSALYEHSPNDMDTGSMDECMRSYTLVREYEPDAAIVATIPSVLLMAATNRGVEALLMDMMVDTDYLRDLMIFSKDVVEYVSDRMFNEAGPDLVVIPGAYDNIDLLGEESLTDVSLPDLKWLYDRCNGNGLDVILHPHGVLTSETGRRTLDLFIDIGFECIYYGEYNDHRTMGELCDGRTACMGGIDSATTIFLGPDERVVKDTTDVLDAMRDRRFIYSCSCSVDRGLDPDRMRLMMDTVREYR